LLLRGLGEPLLLRLPLAAIALVLPQVPPLALSQGPPLAGLVQGYRVLSVRLTPRAVRPDCLRELQAQALGLLNEAGF